MQRLRRLAASFTVAAVCSMTLFAATPSFAATHSHSGFNDQYVFAATRGVNDLDGVHPAFKVPLFPLTVILDVAALPFAVIAGFVA